MNKVEIHDRFDRVIRTVTVEGGEVSVEPQSPSFHRALAEVRVLWEGRRVHPADGVRWLKGLEDTYRGAYFRAVFVAEEEN